MFHRTPLPALISSVVWSLVSLVGLAPLAAGAHALAFSPDGQRLYVTGPSGKLEVIDPSMAAVVTTLPARITAPRFTVHAPLAVSPDGRWLFAAGGVGGTTLYVVDLTTGQRTAAIPVAGTRDDSASDLALSPDGARAYLLAGDPLTSLSVVSVVDTTSGQLVDAIPVYGISEALTPDGTKLYIAGGYSGVSGHGVVSVIDTATDRLIGTIVVQPFPEGIAASPGGRRMYVTHTAAAGATIDVINTVTDMVEGAPEQLQLPGGAALAPAVSPDGRRLYVLPLPWKAVAAISTVGDGVIGTVGVGGDPMDQVMSPDGRRLIVVERPQPGSPSGMISVVDAAALQVVATIPLAEAPHSAP